MIETVILVSAALVVAILLCVLAWFVLGLYFAFRTNRMTNEVFESLREDEDDFFE